MQPGWRRSIRLRLSLAALATLALALALAWAVLAAMFDRRVNQLAEIDLAERAAIVLAGLTPLAEPPAPPPRDLGGDPRFLRPFSGLYWQIETWDSGPQSAAAGDSAGRTGGGDRQIYRSQSLWDQALSLPQPAPAPGPARFVSLQGPDGQALIVLDRVILRGRDDQPVRLALALDRRALTQAQSLFNRDLLPFLAVLGGLLLLASVGQSWVGLRPLRGISRQVAQLGKGQNTRLGQDMPPEIQPLARAIDALLDERDDRIRRARQRAADLAHGLKTPLQALMGEAARLAPANPETAAALESLAERMRRRIDHELGRERIAGEGRADPARIAAGLVAVLARTARGDHIRIENHIAPLPLAIDPEDLAEALGALAENGLRHAHSRLTLRSLRLGAMLALIVADDGPGIPRAERARALERGVSLKGQRLDQMGAEKGGEKGSGLGLALAQDIAQAHGGYLDFGDSDHPLSGARSGAPGQGDFQLRLVLPLAKDAGAVTVTP